MYPFTIVWFLVCAANAGHSCLALWLAHTHFQTKVLLTNVIFTVSSSTSFSFYRTRACVFVLLTNNNAFTQMHFHLNMRKIKFSKTNWKVWQESESSCKEPFRGFKCVLAFQCMLFIIKINNMYFCSFHWARIMQRKKAATENGKEYKQINGTSCAFRKCKSNTWLILVRVFGAQLEVSLHCLFPFVWTNKRKYYVNDFFPTMLMLIRRRISYVLSNKWLHAICLSSAFHLEVYHLQV